MVHRINHHGTFVIDRRYKGIGRIRRASGTKDRKTLKRILGMLTEIHNQGKRSILCEIRDGVVSPMEVYGYWTEGRLEHLPSALSLQPVIPTIPDWIDNTFEGVATTKRNYKSEISRFCKVVGENLPIQDLPIGLKRYRKHCIETTNHRTFNGCRVVLLSYLNKNVGRSHALYGKVSDIPNLKLIPKRKAPQLSVAEAISLIKQLPQAHADIVRAMIYTGMRWNEVIEEGANEWQVEKDRIVIKGTKTKNSDRFVPLIQEILKPARGSNAFRKQLKRLRKDLSPRSFRRSYAHWMEMAGIPRSRRRLYLGHSGPKDTTDIYEHHQVEAFLKEDAQVMEKWIFEQSSRHHLKAIGIEFVDDEDPDRLKLF